MSNISTNDAEVRSKEAATYYRDKNYKAAFAAYLSLAKAGFTASQRFVGWLYFRGEGIAKDYNQALFWFKEAGEKLDAEAMFGMARVYMAKGQHKVAYEWYEKSASMNYLPSLYWIARFHRDGILGRKNETEALRIFQQAATSGHLKSQREYSIMLIKGYAGLFQRILGILYFCRFVALTIYQGFGDRSDPRAVI